MNENNIAKKGGNIADMIKKSSPIFIFACLFIFFAIASPVFFSWDNVTNIIRQASIMGTMAIGQAIVIIGAGIDLSVGSVMAMSGCMMAVMTTRMGVPPELAMFAGLGCSVLVGLLNGVLVTKFKLFDFIATLGVKSIIDGITLMMTDGKTISGLPEQLTTLGSTVIPGVGISLSAILFIGVAIIGVVLLKTTTFGRNVLAIGGNAEAARVSGIDIFKVKIMTNIFCSLCCGFAGLIMLGRINSANPLMGSSLELQTIAAVVIGGVSINGGQGSIGGAFIGILTMIVLKNGLDLLAISPFMQTFIVGIVLVAVVTFDTFRRDKLAAE